MVYRISSPKGGHSATRNLQLQRKFNRFSDYTYSYTYRYIVSVYSENEKQKVSESKQTNDCEKDRSVAVDLKRKDGRPNEKKDNVKQKGKENVKDRAEKEQVTKTSRNQKLERQ